MNIFCKGEHFPQMNKSSCLLVDIKGISSIKIYNPYCFLNWSFVSWKGPLLFQAWSEKNSYWCCYFAPCLAETISVDQLGRSRLFGIHSQIEAWAINTNTSKKLKEAYTYRNSSNGEHCFHKHFVTFTRITRIILPR